MDEKSWESRLWEVKVNHIYVGGWRYDDVEMMLRWISVLVTTSFRLVKHLLPRTYDHDGKLN